MPTGPQGQKRPRDVNACAVMVMKIATGQIEEEYETPTDSRKRSNVSSRHPSVGVSTPP